MRQLQRRRVRVYQSSRNYNLALENARLSEAIKKFEIRAPVTNNELSAPYPFNLMFVTQIGPSGKQTGSVDSVCTMKFSFQFIDVH